MNFLFYLQIFFEFYFVNPGGQRPRYLFGTSMLTGNSSPLVVIRFLTS